MMTPKLTSQVSQSLNDVDTTRRVCLVCTNTTTNPQQLDCQHVFCETCLRDVSDTFRQLHGSNNINTNHLLTCPTCHQHSRTSLPLHNSNSTSGSKLQTPRMRRVSDSPMRCDVCAAAETTPTTGLSLSNGSPASSSSAEATYHCSKCSINVCKQCRTVHDSNTLFKDHNVTHISNRESNDVMCGLHGGGATARPCGYYCVDCERAVCVVCVLHVETGHRILALSDALTVRRDLLRTAVNVLMSRLDRLDDRCRQIIATPHINKIHNTRSRYNRQMSLPMTSPTARKSVTSETSSSGGRRCSQTQQTARHRHISGPAPPPAQQQQQQQHSDSPPPISATNSDHSCSDISTASSETDFIDVFMTSFMTHVARLHKLFEFATKMLELSHTKKLLLLYDELVCRIQTVVDVDIKLLHSWLDELLATEYLTHRRHSNCGCAACGDTDSESSHTGSDELIDSAETPAQCTQCRPTLVWKIERQRTEGASDMWNPCDVTFLPDETKLIVAEYSSSSNNNNNSRLELIDVATGHSSSILGRGKLQPLGVTVTRDGQHIAVTDCHGKRVRLLSLATGQIVSDLGKGQFGWPYGIATNSRGQLIVSDAFNDTVSIYSTDGKKLRCFGSSGSTNTQFRNPYHVTVGASDEILVTDSGNDCVKVFSVDGRFMMRTMTAAPAASRASFSAVVDRDRTESSSRRHLRSPRGVAIHQPTDSIFVTDDKPRVAVFGSNGVFVRNILSDEDGLRFPESVCVSKSGLMAVTECNRHNMFAIKLFNIN